VPWFPISNHSCHVQIYPLCFEPSLTNLSVLPCKDPSTLPPIRESDALVACRINF
jgi:hypothetical protein